MEITERLYLELAEDCKNKIKEKERLIDWYKYRLNEIDDSFRLCEYKVKQVMYLLEYKSKNKKENDKIFYQMLKDANDYLISNIDTGRNLCQEIDDDTEEVILTLTSLESSTESIS